MKENNCILQKNLQNAKNRAGKNLENKGFCFGTIFAKRKVPEIQVRVIKDKLLHAKMVLIDESLLIIGSANLTLSGLHENIESYVVLTNADIATESLTRFEELWNMAVSLENVNSKIAEEEE